MAWHGITDGKDRVNVGANGALDVNIQDPTSPVIILPLSKMTNTTTLSIPAIKDAYSFTVTSVTGSADKAFICICDSTTGRIFWGHQIGVAVGNVISVDRPLPFAFGTGVEVFFGTHNMNVNGATTTQTFCLRPGNNTVPVTIDITRIMIVMLTDSAVSLAKFGDIPALTKGITLRHVNGATNNILNIKSNVELAGMAFDFNVFEASNPVQGQDGLVSRLTFSKMGAVIRVGAGEDLELLINDDLSALGKFNIIAEGSVVTDN